MSFDNKDIKLVENWIDDMDNFGKEEVISFLALSARIGHTTGIFNDFFKTFATEIGNAKSKKEFYDYATIVINYLYPQNKNPKEFEKYDNYYNNIIKNAKIDKQNFKFPEDLKWR